MAGSGNNLVFLGAIGALAYFTRNSWLPTVEADFPQLAAMFPNASVAAGEVTPSSTGLPVASPYAAVLQTGMVTPGPSTPGATPVGPPGSGCYQYPTGVGNSMAINCPQNTVPSNPATGPLTPPPPANNCAAGFTQDAAGICTKYPDAVLLANLNSIPWTGFSDIPSEQIARIDPQILAMYSTTTGVNGGTALAFMLGLGGTAPDGTIMNGSDGNAYKSLGGVFYRQGTSTSATVNGVSLGRLGAVAKALPITNATLIMASADPTIAALVGRDQRAMLTAAQWNAYYTQATGIVQGIALHPQDMQGALMSAEQYQARRKAAGLETVTNLGTLRPARRGAFPLGRIGLINQWIPPGNRNIFYIPGRGAVPAGRNGRIPARSSLGLITDGGGNHRWARSPFPRPGFWREAEGNPLL